MQALLKSPTSTLKGFFALGVMAICGTLLWHQIAAIPREDLMATFQTIAPWQWTLAFVATACSFFAVGRYDAVWHHRLKTGVPRRQARRTGMAAIAIGQTIGAGTVTGAFVRWHLLPQLGFKTTTGITLGVSLSFLACWAVLGLGAGVWLGLLPALPTLLTVLIIVVIGAFVATGRGAKIRSLRPDAIKLIRLTAIDVGFAGLALWALIPEAGIALIIPVIAAYIVALGAGLISNTPGGLGAFDLCLLALLPKIPEADALAAILAFRAVYYLIPAIVAAAYLAKEHLQNRRQSNTTAAPISDLCRQGARVGTTGWVIRRHLLGTVALEPSGLGTDLSNWGTPAIGFQALYKTDAKLAQQARSLGWSVRRIADDALITPQNWSLEGPKMRQLRRKIGQAAKAGVRIVQSTDPLPIEDMTHIAHLWSQHHGGELGYSMGRYSPTYVATQRVYLIWDGPMLCGFITVQERAATWAIDVIRHGPDMPAGAIHAAYATIISDAKDYGANVLSLGAVPTANTGCKHQLKFRTAKSGLVQFKQSFGPRWVPLYHAAPTRLQWAVSMAHIVWHVQRPLPRCLEKALRSLKSLIIMSNIFHLIPSLDRDIPAENIAPARATSKAAPHDQQRIRNASV
jgi:phosphatidylglycerol lysyltransferase